MINELGCIVKLDRWRFSMTKNSTKSITTPPSVPGFQVVRDSFVRQQAKVRTYQRVRAMESPESGTKLYIQYLRSHGWLDPMLITVVGSDESGILPAEFFCLSTAFENVQTKLVEPAFDFAESTGVDLEYVRRHALFGKSQPRNNPKYPDQLWYGTRRSSRFVRAYFKNQVQAFRVEVEQHGSWPGIPGMNVLGTSLPWSQDDFRFVDVNWTTLEKHLSRNFTDGPHIIEIARKHYESSVHDLLSALRNRDVNNPHTFLQVASKNGLISHAFDVWREALHPGSTTRGQKRDYEDDEN